MSYSVTFEAILNIAGKNYSPILSRSPVPAKLSPALNLCFLTLSFTFKNLF